MGTTTGTGAPARGSSCPVFDAAVLSRRTLASWPGLEISVARARFGAGVVSASRSPEHKLFLTLAGATKLTETRTEGGRPYSGRDAPGAVSLVPAGRRREGRYVGGWMEYVRLLIEPALLRRLAGGAGLSPADNVRDPLVQGVILALKEEAERGGQGGRAYAEALVAGMGADHFARAFRRATGKPPHRYLTGLRLERARELLAATDRPIAEIAHRVGLSSQSHLTTLFRREYGSTPHAYRRGHAALAGDGGA